MSLDPRADLSNYECLMWDEPPVSVDQVSCNSCGVGIMYWDPERTTSFEVGVKYKSGLEGISMSISIREVRE